MTKKDYELIAKILAKDLRQAKSGEFMRHNPIDIFTALPQQFAEVLAKNDPKFSRNKFLQACGMETVEVTATAVFTTRGEVTTVQSRYQHGKDITAND